MTKVHFIVNPIAGKGQWTFDEEFLSNYLEGNLYELTVKISEYQGHASILAKQSIQDGAKIMVACGGDGTINEVASCLVHTDILLGIVPIGSGNGLAESLDIPRNIERALDVIKRHSTKKIDVAKVNGKPFFSNMGIGFDAKVISNYNASHQRRLLAYLKAFMKSLQDFKYGSKIKVEMNGKSFRTEPFMFFVSNSKVMGYDISLTRMASLQDGLLDVVIIDNVNKAEILFLGLLTVLRLNRYLKKVKYHRAKELRIAFEDTCRGHLMQADGELHNLREREVYVSIEEKALHVLCP